MKKHLFIVCLLQALLASATKDPLISCWNLQVKPLQGQYLQLTCHEEVQELYHAARPWEYLSYTGSSHVWLQEGQFVKIDTLLTASGKRSMSSKTEWATEKLLFQDYGEDSLSAITAEDLETGLLRSLRYSPLLLIHVAKEQALRPFQEGNADATVYELHLHQTQVKLYVDAKEGLVHQVTVLSNDELYGDVMTSYSYADYTKKQGLSVPQHIRISRLGGKLLDEVEVRTMIFSNAVPDLLKMPEHYALQSETATGPEIKTYVYLPHIYFMDMYATDDRVLLVEFKDFLLIAEAPLNSANGERILAQAHQLFPQKPVRYFVFGHHHAHYLGGIRSMVAEGARVLCVKEDTAYVNQLIRAPHRLCPDTLERHPKAVSYELVDSIRTISDGQMSLQICHIGRRSGHTEDYLIYYFPDQKIVFEDDLMGRSNKATPSKASARELGLYKAIVEFGLRPETVIQSWPLRQYGLKTIVPFSELEAIVQKKE